MDSHHQDFAQLQPIRDAIAKRVDKESSIEETFPLVVANAVDYVIDPVRTGRTQIRDLDNVEKTIIGLKIEHFVRDWLGVPPGIRDLDIDGFDVDVKNTVGTNWMIPMETYSEVRSDGSEPGGTCLLIKIDEVKNQCSLGLLRVRDQYLNRPNRDQKKSVSASGQKNIMWLIRNRPYQEGHWQEFDMAEFRYLRQLKGGNKRVIEFFNQHMGLKIHRSVILALLFDQKDPMKRLRWNGGAKNPLWQKRQILISGEYFHNLAASLGVGELMPEFYVLLAIDNYQEILAREHGYFKRQEN